MNLAEARAELAARGFDYLPAGRQTTMLNNARNDLEDYWPWPWLDEFIAGPAPLTIPDLKLVTSVKNGAVELIGLDYRQIAQNGTDPNQPGTPRYWWLEGPNILHVWPVAAVTVSVAYLVESPELSDPDDTPLIPARYHPLWIDLAVVEAYKDSDNFTGAQALRADVLVRLADIVGRYEVRNRQHSRLTSWHAGLSEDD